MLTFLVWAAITSGAVLVGAHQMSPERRAYRRMERLVQAAMKPWIALFDLRGALEVKLEMAAREYVGAWRDRVLGRTDIDELRAYADGRGMRLGALRDGGMETVAQLVRVGPAGWLRVPGVGPQTANWIKGALDSFSRNLNQRTVPLPDSGFGEAFEVELIDAARGLLAWMEHASSLEARAKEISAQATRELQRYRDRSGFWSWVSPFKGSRRDVEPLIRSMDEVLSPEDQAHLALLRAVGTLVESVAETRLPLHDLRADYDRRRADYVAVLEPYISGENRVREVPSELSPEIMALIERLTLVTDGLKVSLRGYQNFGAKFMVVQRRTLVGDEMGLGKTIQALAAMTHLRNKEGAKHFMVVCPSSIVENWERELRGRSDLRVCVLRGPDRFMATADWIGSGGVGLTSFETLRSGDILDAMRNHRIRVAMAIGDEAHYVKNPDAGRTRSFRKLSENSERVCLMTGTPIENRLAEFRNIVSHFSPEYAHKLQACTLPDAAAKIRRNEFMAIVAPIYLRRNQTDVLTELPEKIEKDEWVALNDADRRAYQDAVRSRNFMAMRRTATIGRGDGVSAKFERLAELVDEYREEGRKMLIFSFFLDVLQAVSRQFPGSSVINGSVPSAKRTEMMDGFQAAAGFQILACQIGVGGVGLNLQAESVVVILEPQWKPSTENQAIARAHRMGQTRAVIVHRLLAEDCVDERMNDILSTKQALFDAYARDSALKESASEATEKRVMQDIIEAELARIGA